MAMKITGKTVVGRSPEELWDLLLDPEVLRRCIPGCEELERATDNTYRVRIKIGLGLIKGNFLGDVSVEDLQRPESYRMLVQAKGSTGFINGETSVRLVPFDGGHQTELEYEGEAHIGGVVASVGARLFQGAARNFSQQFFHALSSL